MNKDRRKEIDRAIALIVAAETAMQEAIGAIADIESEEQDFFDNMPENMQEGDRGNTAQEAIDALQEATSFAEQIDFADIIDQLENAKG